jgi:hypothetical protein
MLGDAQWALLEPLVEVCRPKGKTPPQDLRRTISAILWRHQNGAKWRAIPEELPLLDRLSGVPKWVVGESRLHQPSLSRAHLEHRGATRDPAPASRGFRRLPRVDL